MRITRRRFLGASSGLVAGLSISPLLTRAAGSPMMPAWTTSAPPVPGLGYLTALAVDPIDPTILLAGGDVHGMKKTTDAGQLWGQIDAELWQAGRYGVAAITPHPGVAFQGTYYLLSGSDNSKGSVYKTLDYGKHWRLLATGIVTMPQTSNGVLRVYGRLLALDTSGSGDTLYAASYSDGLYKSTDGGVHWSNNGALAGKNLTAVVLDPTSPSTVYVGWRFLTDTWTDTRGGVMVSIDGGRSWNPLLSDVPVRDLVIDPNEPSSIYVAALAGTAVSGTTVTGGVWRRVNGKWSNPNVGLPLTNADGPTFFNAIEVNPNPGHVGEVLVGTGEGNAPATHGSVYRSVDRANSWKSLVTSTNVHADDTVIVPSFYYLGGNGDAISAVLVPPSQPNTIWVSGRSLTWFSTDGGANWSPSSAGLEGAGRHFDVGVDPTTGSLYMGTGDWVLIRSDPARQTFALLSLPSAGQDARSLCFAFTTRRLLLGAGSKDATADVGGVYTATTGDGTSWTVADPNLPAARVVGLATAPSNPDVVYAALARNGIYKSTDGGTSFARMSVSGLPDSTKLFPGSFTKIPIAVHPADANVVYFLDHVHGLFVYSPSSAIWNNVSGGVSTTGTPVDTNAPYQGFALDPTQPALLYVASCAGLFRSANAGKTWTPVGIANTEGFGPVVVDPRSGTVFASTALPGESSALSDRPGIYASVDGGITWGGAYVDGRFAVNFDALAVDPGKAQTVWAASAGSLFMVTPAP